MLTSAIAVAGTDPATADRYESLIRIATSIRSRTEPQELFGILVHELGPVLQFDALSYHFDEASNCKTCPEFVDQYAE